MQDAPQNIKVLVINVGVDPIKTERFEFPIGEAKIAGAAALEVMNRMGKNSEALFKKGNVVWLLSHTSARGPSKSLYHSKINYHPLMKELE